LRFHLSKPYFNRRTHKFERLVLGEGKMHFTKTKIGKDIVTRRNADEYFYPFVFNPRNSIWYGKSVWTSEADDHWTYYKIRDVRFGNWYRRYFANRHKHKNV